MPMLEKSDNLKIRQLLNHTLRIPSLTETLKELGAPLTKILFEECPQALRKLMSLEPMLEGAQGDLWTSPSDLLIGKVILKPPFTNRCIKALTHKGIIEIGQIIEEKYHREMELERKRALQQQEELLQLFAEQERNKAVRDALAQCTQMWEERQNHMKLEFEACLQEELADLAERMTAENDQRLQEETGRLAANWEDILVANIHETTRNLTMKFLDDLHAQEAMLTEKFELDLNGGSTMDCSSLPEG